MIRSSNSLLVTPHRTLIMQQRDDTPGLVNAGKITAFGGAIEDGESPLEAITREISEETNLRPVANDFTPFRMYQNPDPSPGNAHETYYFILHISEPDDLQVYEGQGYVEVNPQNIVDWDFTELARRVVTEYFSEAPGR